MSLGRILLVSFFLCATHAWAQPQSLPDWQTPLAKKIKKIDDSFRGDLGVAVHSPLEAATFDYQASRPWYLSSTTKVLIAISVLKEIEAGHLSLNQNLTLQQKDFVDGSGPLLYHKPGEVFKLSYLLEQMLTQSDSTATDMLFRLVGENKVQQQVQKIAPGFGAITSIVDVRFAAYGELHPKAQQLTNMDFIAFKKSPARQRAQAFAKKIKVPLSSLKYSSIDPAFEAYYAKGSNSGSLVVYAHLLDQLNQGKILNPAHTDLILQHMKNMKTGADRIKVGLKKDYQFFQKTGTQVRRMCNVGIIKNPKTQKSITIAACAEKFGDPGAAKKAFQQIGRAVTEAALL